MLYKNKDHKKDHSNSEVKQAKEDAVITITKEEYKQLKESSDKSKEYFDRFLRLQADFDNAKKRLQKEKEDYVRYANQDIVLELLNILDDLERAVQAAEEKHQDLTGFLKGIEMILAHLYQMLKEKGVSPIEAKGKKFDPSYHEAMMQVETGELPEDCVVEELQKGYLLNDKVLRTSKVKVSKKIQEAEKEENT